MTDRPDLLSLNDTDLDKWYRAINQMWLSLQIELAERRRTLGKAEDKAAAGWPEYRNVEELDQRDAAAGDADNDAFK